MIDKIIEFWENLSGWGKAIGVTSLFGLIVLAVFLIVIAQQHGGDQIVNVPSQVNDIKEDAQKELVKTGVKTSTTVTGQVIDMFHKAGQDIANTAPDKATQNSIIMLMTFGGIMLAGVIVIAIMKPILEMVLAIGKALPF